MWSSQPQLALGNTELDSVTEKSLKNTVLLTTNAYLYICVCLILLDFFHHSHIPCCLNVLSLMSTGRGKVDVSVPITTGEC